MLVAFPKVRPTLGLQPDLLTGQMLLLQGLPNCIIEDLVDLLHAPPPAANEANDSSSMVLYGISNTLEKNIGQLSNYTDCIGLHTVWRLNVVCIPHQVCFRVSQVVCYQSLSTTPPASGT